MKISTRFAVAAGAGVLIVTGLLMMDGPPDEREREVTSDPATLQQPAEPGLVLGVGGDARVARMVALHVPEGSPPTPFVAPGPFTATWEGFLVVDDFDDYTFSVTGRGSFRLKIDGEIVLDADRLDDVAPVEVELEPGERRIEVRYESPTRGDAMVRLFWASPDFAAEPVPPSRFRHPPAHGRLIRGQQMRRGRELVAEGRCLACHESSLDGMPELAGKAPSFSQIGSRLNAEWIAAWTENPKALRPWAMMPRLLGDNKEEARSIAAYLASLGSPSKSKGQGSAGRGSDLYDTLGCGTCHARDRMPLDGVGRKWQPAALASFLLQPDRFFPATRMPDFRLSDEEAFDLAAFLLAGSAPPRMEFSEGDLGKGRDLVWSSGCAACHETGHENMLQGPAFDGLDPASGCLAVTAKKRGEAPDFGFSDEDRASLVAFLKRGIASLGRRCAPEYAQRRIRDLQCGACHTRDGRVDLWSELGDGGADAEYLQTRPRLTWAGERFRTDWLARFLAGETRATVRPWLTARMPRFPMDARLMAEGLRQQHGIPIEAEDTSDVNDEQAAAGKRLIARGTGFSCVACHDAGDEKATGSIDARGPDLRYTPQRIRKAFFHRWMMNPARVTPGTKMPLFVSDDRSPFTDVHDGDPRMQFESMWEYFRSLP